MGKRETNEEKEEIIRLFNEGYWTDEISEKLGIGENKVKMFLSTRGLSFRPIPKSGKWQEDFRRDWNEAVRRLRG